MRISDVGASVAWTWHWPRAAGWLKALRRGLGTSDFSKEGAVSILTLLR